MKQLIASFLVSIVASLAVADGVTYNWIAGNKGDWNEPSNWMVGKSVAEGYPADGDTAVFGAGDSHVTISNTIVIAAIRISTQGTHSFRSNTPSTIRTVQAATSTMDGTGGGTLVLSAVKMTTSRFDTVAGLKRLALEDGAEFYFPNEPTSSDLELDLVGGGKFAPSWMTPTMGTLKVGRTINYIECNGENTVSFQGFENLGDMGYCNVQNGKVKFRDLTGIRQIGGEGSFEYNTPQIKVAPDFCFNMSNWHRNKGIAAISNNVVVALQPDTMRQGFEGAGALDNIYVSTDGCTLTEDVTVNAVMYDGTIDLNGHVLTVKSGVIRQGWLASPEVKNGIVRIANPAILVDGTNNTTVRFLAEIETVDNDDPYKPMMTFYGTGGSYPANNQYTNFVGKVVTPFSTWHLRAGRFADQVVVAANDGSINANSHNNDFVVRGLQGNAKVACTSFNNTIWVGDCTAEQFAMLNSNQIANWGVYVSTNGVIEPGAISYDGGRRGALSMTSVKERVTNFTMDDGGTIRVSLHADGDASALNMYAIDTSYGWSKGIAVTLAGTLEVNAAGKLRPGSEYPVITYREGCRTGKFSHVSDGYRVTYDVLQPDGNYAVVLTVKDKGGFRIFVR